MEGLILNASKVKPGDENYQELVQEEQHNEPEQKRKRKTFHFPESKLQEMRETYSKVVVRDFNDDYHMSMDEKISKFDLYQFFNPIRNHKSYYTKIEKYVVAMRECFAFVEAMAKKNRLVMDPEEFMANVFSGRIEIAQLTFPKYKGRDRKDINWKNVRNYIIDTSLNPADLSMKKSIEYLDEDILENPDDHIKEFFDDDQIETIFNSKKTSHTTVYDPELDEAGSAAVSISKKEMKKFLKSMPELIRGVRDIRNRLQGENQLLSDFVYDMSADAYGRISDLDEKRGFLASDNIPRFAGDINNKDDVNSYLYKLDEFMEEHQRVNYHGNFITLSQYKDEQLKDGLDAAGWNVMKLYSNKDEAKKVKRDDKRDKKLARKLREKLSKVEKRRELREKGVNTKKKKPSKKSKNATKKIDNAAAISHGTSSYKEYEDMMLDMSYGYNGED